MLTIYILKIKQSLHFTFTGSFNKDMVSYSFWALQVHAA